MTMLQQKYYAISCILNDYSKFEINCFFFILYVLLREIIKCWK